MGMKMSDSIFAEGFKTDPYWWDAVPRDAGAGLPAEALPDRADVVVVGSGYAGLHAAITLSRAGSDVVVLEAEPLGLGASTRNGGMVSGGVNVGKHAIRAGAVIIATNGYSGDLSPWHQRRVVPVPSYQIATEELGADRVTELFPTHRMIADTKRLLYYFRPSPDRKRVLFGGRARYLKHDPAAGAAFLRSRLLRVFPQLDGVW